LSKPRAEECEREAERAAEPELKKTYLARAWRDVADDITNNRLLASPRRRTKGTGDEMA
jgi:hypothetical protein